MKINYRLGKLRNQYRNESRLLSCHSPLNICFWKIVTLDFLNVSRLHGANGNSKTVIRWCSRTAAARVPNTLHVIKCIRIVFRKYTTPFDKSYDRKNAIFLFFSNPKNLSAVNFHVFKHKSHGYISYDSYYSARKLKIT